MYRAAITNAAAAHTSTGTDDAAHTALTNLFSGGPARGLINRLMRELGPLSELPPQFPLASTAIAPLRSAAEKQQRGDFSPLWCGQNASGCRELPLRKSRVNWRWVGPDGHNVEAVCHVPEP